MQPHGTAVSLVCPTCAETFTVPQSAVRKGRKFCSNKCARVRAAKPGTYRNVVVDGKLVKKHRLIMEQALGRPLLPTEIVHHVDEDPSNNDPSNLEVCASQREHTRKHSKAYISETERECADCHIIKPNSHYHFYTNMKSGYRYRKSYCKSCDNARARDSWRKKRSNIP